MSGAEEFSGFSKLVCTRTLFLHEGTHISFAVFLVDFWVFSLGSGCRVPKRIREITQLLSFQLSPKPYFGHVGHSKALSPEASKHRRAHGCVHLSVSALAHCIGLVAE